MDLSVLIPARSEEWLARTVADVLEHAKAETEVIVVLDGAWAEPPLVQHPRVTVVHHPESVGQRAATNEAARLASGRYVMKLDAHCSLADGFDVALIEAAKELGPDVTQIPSQKNLHVWSWRCAACSHEWHQGPTPTSCAKCPATAGFERVIVWKPRRGTTTTNWVFDETLHFQYDSAGAQRQQGDICDVMTSLGACFFMERARFWEIGGLDEKHGSWGNYGVEIALKSWLSGGRHVVNKRTHFAHFFRVGGIGFPYPMKGSDQERARQYSRDLWLNNAWPGQILPLSWLIEKFRPLPGWHDAPGAARLADVVAAGAAFSLREESGLALGRERGEIPCVDADAATTPAAPASREEAGRGQLVPVGAMGLPGLSGARAVAAQDVHRGRYQLEVGRVAARWPATDEVVQNADRRSRQRPHEPGVHDSVEPGLRAGGIAGREANATVAESVGVAGPEPAASLCVNDEPGEDPRDGLAVEVGDRQNTVSHDSASRAELWSGASGVPAPRVPSILPPARRPSRSVLYYSHETADPEILEACRRQLRRAAAGLPIVSVTLKPVDLGFNVVLPQPPGILTMIRQQLVGLKLIDADIVYFAENDCLYPPEHFEFIPEGREAYYYDTAWWKVDAATGRALHYEGRQLSGLCAYRSLLVQHYERRLERVEREGYSRATGFEPGTHRRAARIDDYRAQSWQSPVPYIDVRHNKNLTPSRWQKDQFRDQRYTAGWTEADEVPGWGRTAGRFRDWLAEVAR